MGELPLSSQAAAHLGCHFVGVGVAQRKHPSTRLITGTAEYARSAPPTSIPGKTKAWIRYLGRVEV